MHGNVILPWGLLPPPTASLIREKKGSNRVRGFGLCGGPPSLLSLLRLRAGFVFPKLVFQNIKPLLCIGTIRSKPQRCLVSVCRFRKFFLPFERAAKVEIIEVGRKDRGRLCQVHRRLRQSAALQQKVSQPVVRIELI